MVSLLKKRRQEMLDIASRHGAHDVRVFGSAARGDIRPDSDIDLIIRLDSDRSLLDLIAIKQDMEDLLGREVHVVTEASISPYIRESILGEAESL